MQFNRPPQNSSRPDNYILANLLEREYAQLSKSLVRVEQDDRGVTAIFADGTRETGDLLVGADGSRSARNGSRMCR